MGKLVWVLGVGLAVALVAAHCSALSFVSGFTLGQQCSATANRTCDASCGCPPGSSAAGCISNTTVTWSMEDGPASYLYLLGTIDCQNFWVSST